MKNWVKKKQATAYNGAHTVDWYFKERRSLFDPIPCLDIKVRYAFTNFQIAIWQDSKITGLWGCACQALQAGGAANNVSKKWIATPLQEIENLTTRHARKRVCFCQCEIELGQFAFTRVIWKGGKLVTKSSFLPFLIFTVDIIRAY